MTDIIMPLNKQSDFWNNHSIPALKIETYHFFKKKFENDPSIVNISKEKIKEKIKSLVKPEDKTYFLTITNFGIVDFDQSLSPFLSIGYSFGDTENAEISIMINNEAILSSPSNFNLILIESDFSGILKISSTGGERVKTQNSFETSINILHYQIHQRESKSLYIFDFKEINNNPLSLKNGRLPEDETLPVFLNYYNLTNSLNSNYKDNNFVFNLSVPASINFFQTEQYKQVLKNNVIVNTIPNPFNNEEHKVDVKYFHCIGKGQWRDDSFEVNHICPNFHSEINYFVLNKGTAASQINTYIAPDAPRSKSHQHLKHIMLEDGAVSFSKPNLMIENPDVESSHGNTMGGLNREHLIYLQQRGINEDRAKSILARSAIENATETVFFAEIIKTYFREGFL